MTVQEIAQQFATDGNIGDIKPHGGGHINDSYHLVNGQADQPDYLLQRVNHYVFKDVELLMQNMVLVTDHIAAKVEKVYPGELERHSLTIIPAIDGKSFFRDPEGNYWRVLRFIEDHLAFESTTDPAIAYEGARMFGAFTKMLDDLPVKGVGTIIPDFHNMKWRLTQLEESIREDKAGRLKLVKKEIDYVESSSKLMLTIHELGEKGAIPLRITHNDTKISNVLFDTNHKGLCVIDLDTTQPGYVTSDFGDGIRTLTNTGEEDDDNLDRVTMDLALYEAFASGFLESTREILSKTEIDSLVYAGLLFPYMQAVRFLADYLAGDVYYKIKHKEHNLVRTRAQIKLAQDGEAKMDKLKEIISGLA
ncbi:MAG: aminoglycoside phosphotransferase family protein [Bacteroidales bacterium]|nr:aminoglycoside phosphotransferase family protein [Bacteroidales bacterium]